MVSRALWKEAWWKLWIGECDSFCLGLHRRYKSGASSVLGGFTRNSTVRVFCTAQVRSKAPE